MENNFEEIVFLITIWFHGSKKWSEKWYRKCFQPNIQQQILKFSILTKNMNMNTWVCLSLYLSIYIIGSLSDIVYRKRRALYELQAVCNGFRVEGVGPPKRSKPAVPALHH